MKRDSGKGSGRLGFLFSTGDPRPQPVLFRVSVALLVLFLLAVSFSQIRSFDIGFHLATGEIVARERSIPRADPFSYSAAGEPWLSHEWLFGLLSRGAWGLGGAAGLATLKAALVALAFLLAAVTARRRGASAGAILFVLALAYAVARPRFQERPELASLCLALGFLLAHEAGRRRSWIPAAVFPTLQLLWVNLHGGTALLGVGLAGALLLDRIYEMRSSAGRVPLSSIARRARAQLIAAAATGLASFANPHGAGTLSYGLLRAESPLENREFQSLWEILSRGWDLSTGCFALFGLLVVAVLARRRRGGHIVDWLTFPFLLALSLVFYRFSAYFVLLLAPALAARLSEIPLLKRAREWIPLAAGAVVLAAGARAEVSSFGYRFGSGYHAGIFPVEAVSFLDARGFTGRLYNSYRFGGYLIWTRWPAHRVFIDGREDVYLGPGVLAEYVGSLDSRENWESLVRKYGFDYALVRYPEAAPADPAASIEAIAFPRDRWALVYFDDVAVIYARREGENAGKIAGLEIEAVRPLQDSSYLDGVLQDATRTRLFLEEMSANLAARPESFRASFTMGVFTLKRDPQLAGEALAWFRKAASINPDFAPAWINLGAVYAHLGRRAEAEDAYRKALSLERNDFAEQELNRLLRR